ncbi:MAG: ECF transporter S component [Lachnospiraceae bacterium]|nr:ECF transporter S component [Lachnospiraceae bacterium]
MKNTQTLVLAALLAALTYIATTVIKIPTPTFGYVHIGDTFVLLSGFLLGPVIGGLSAGVGSMLADLLGGYAIWAPGTFTIKLATAMAAAAVFRALNKPSGNNKRLHLLPRAIVAGIAGEAVMIFGYFLYNILVLTLVNTGAESITLSAAVAESLAEIPFNAVQAVVGIGLSNVLLPVTTKLPARQVNS